MSGERDDGLTLQVVSMLLEEGEHPLRISAPPDGTTDEYGVVATQINVALVLWQFAFLRLFLFQIDEWDFGFTNCAIVFTFYRNRSFIYKIMCNYCYYEEQ